ncbi:MAG: hypothetical protein Q7U98_14225 [Methylicorpusculum sp.]|uniref:hypothetical protein n=1 Tax=Methylicorpusculum sp. TaxID=2713644 RepID=UPI002717C820|nr:hypothetical protein [Methylicorpusculum sp.]MDO8940305.1 hypothetical protein [Methylicorpusculum sp.]MDP2203929.1 hypothetical protein [Methylicorpusculum sp.]
MASLSYATWILEQEARALMTRLNRVKPFALHETMVPAASILPSAQTGIESYLIKSRQELRGMIQHYIRWLRGPSGQSATPAHAQRLFSILRLRFNGVLTQFDLFSDALTQRSENEIGVWLSGLDVVSADALRLPGDYYDAPPVICYLDRGVGAAIRRARTRLPGGGENPVAVIRVPRERMVGSSIASSLVHEVGHQAAALLDLVNSLRPVLQGLQRGSGPYNAVWSLWERWISEIVADFWSVARVGIASTLGLMGVVSLPRAFVFRLNLDDPHPPPWIRVKLSCAMGQALYPHPQWERLAGLWDAFYPLNGLEVELRRDFDKLQATLPGFVALLVNHRPKCLRGQTLVDVLEVHKRQPRHLQAHFQTWRKEPSKMYRTSPILAFAVIGQARSDGRLSPEEESVILAKLLTHWALSRTLSVSAACAGRNIRYTGPRAYAAL